MEGMAASAGGVPRESWSADSSRVGVRSRAKMILPENVLVFRFYAFRIVACLLPNCTTQHSKPFAYVPGPKFR